MDGTIRAETTKDVVNDILTYKAAACAKVRQAIAKRTSDEAERNACSRSCAGTNGSMTHTCTG